LQLLAAVPAMHDAVPAEDRIVARRVLLAPARAFTPGAMTLPEAAEPRHPFAMVVVTGTVLRETHLGGRSVVELLGTSDIIETHPDDELTTLVSRTEYFAQQPTTVAILDDRFRLAARRWPALHQVVGEQHARQARRASRHLAALALTRVEDRVIAVFCELSDRWGRVTPAGIRIDIPLTHTVIGQLVAAQRPTVSLALKDLAAACSLTRQADQSWLLSRDAVATA
jgi:CRP-like cAMP-binding protein